MSGLWLFAGAKANINVYQQISTDSEVMGLWYWTDQSLNGFYWGLRNLCNTLNKYLNYRAIHCFVRVFSRFLMVQQTNVYLVQTFHCFFPAELQWRLPFFKGLFLAKISESSGPRISYLFLKNKNNVNISCMTTEVYMLSFVKGKYFQPGGTFHVGHLKI